MIIKKVLVLIYVYEQQENYRFDGDYELQNFKV